jgi:uncharacterized protein (DUF697 family)
MSIFTRFIALINPSANPDIEPAFSYKNENLPILWLLGKTGAGKSSLIHAITGDDSVKIGNGFQPCTLTASSYDFPQDKPLFSFLDTRGLAEANYDASADIAACQDRSHALVIVAKAEDPEQSSVLNALQQIKKSGDISQLLLVHTGVELIADLNERQQCISYNQEQVEKIWDSKVESVAVDFDLEDGSTVGVDELKEKLAELLPILAQINDDKEHASLEERNFSQVNKEVLWYSAAAGASDAIPAVGLVSVPAIQGKMLHSLANQYDVEWNSKTLTEFVGALGAGFGVQYASKLGIRQLLKFIPVYGQTVGSASAAAISFGSTYAIGRAACMYLFYKSKGEVVSKEELQAMYKSALNGIKEVAKSETNS